MTHDRSFHHPGGAALIEEAVYCLKHLAPGLFVVYYAGTLPFVTGLLYFWGDMSRSALAEARLSPSALGLALLFVWMKCLQSVFCHRILAHLGARSPAKVPMSAMIRHISFQSLIHASSFVVLPLALVMTLPYAWVYAFYQNSLLADCPAGKSFAGIIRDTYKTASLQPGQNHMIILNLFVFKLVVLINVALFIYALPHLAQSLLGIASVFTLGGFSALNTTFLLIVLCLTHLCVDPLVKTVYTLRFFYGTSEKSGDDLKVALKRLAAPALLPLLAVLIVSVTAPPARADVPDRPAPDIEAGSLIEADRLEQSVREVLTRREFAWRLPQETAEDLTKPGMIESFIAWLASHITSFFKGLDSWVDRLVTWMKKFFPNPDGRPFDTQKPRISPSIRYLLYGLCALTVLILMVLAVRTVLARKRRRVMADTLDVPMALDLADEQVGAEDLPGDAWQHVAQSLIDQGDFRLAMRALYLATLARLSEQQLIVLARYKSNRDYVDELARRGHGQTDRLALFRESVGRFEGIWYGLHPVDRDTVLGYARTQERILGHAL